MTDTLTILRDLNRAKVLFQQRALLAALGVTVAAQSCTPQPAHADTHPSGRGQDEKGGVFSVHNGGDQ